MLAIRPAPAPETEQATERAKCEPNVLPCKIKFNGPVNANERYWCPRTNDEPKATHTVYFRGRKLLGRSVKMPDGYEGAILKSSERVLEPADSANEGDDVAMQDANNEEPAQPVKILEELATFDEITVWGHEEVPSSNDPYVKGIEEWISFAEALQSSFEQNE